MSTIFFLALQCCQCSTMQVKQRKKNSKSHQWSCVVCNQKQSIRKVFAEGPMAKDLRLFVQSFNMSRHSHSSQPLPTATTTAEPLSHGSSKRPRSDWSEFLDPEEEISDPDPKPTIDFEVEIITELPGDKPFKKAKLNKYPGQDELHKPVFSKRSASTEVVFKKDQVHDTDEKKLKKVLVREEASKWSQYLTGDDNCDDYYPVDVTSDELLDSILIDELVEDD